MDDALVVGVDGTEDTRKDLEGQFVVHAQPDPEAAGAEVGQRHRTQGLRRDADLLTHLQAASLGLSPPLRHLWSVPDLTQKVRISRRTGYYTLYGGIGGEESGLKSARSR
jgi:hypothetical protein